jgi:hypothetical protein
MTLVPPGDVVQGVPAETRNEGVQDRFVTNDVDTLATAHYATTDDMLKEHPDLAPWRPPVGITPRLSDAELVTSPRCKRSDLAGGAEYGYCASHSRFFWGLRLHLVCTLQGLPIAFALTGAKADERETFKGQLGLERRRGRTPGDVIARVMQRILALTAAIWHNDATGQTVLRSLIAYAH